MFYKLHNFEASVIGVFKSILFLIISGRALRGLLIGVNPVRPSIKLSKLKVPFDGVLIRIVSKACDGCIIIGTFRVFGLFGREAGLNVIAGAV